METVFIEEPGLIDKTQLFDVYRSGIRDNAKYYNETEQQIEQAHWDYLVDFLEKQHGILAILKDGEKYIAAIRVLPKKNNEYFCEAFEVAEGLRGKGFGKQLYRDVIKFIENKNKHFKIEAHTWKTNYASIKAHTGVGFEIVNNYTLNADGTKNESQITFGLNK